MITFQKYRKFLDGLAAQGIHSSPVDHLLRKEQGSYLFILKHDVEANLPLALKLARIEADCGHFATYYFQGDLLLEKEAAEIVKEIADLGHEAAYHYDVLDSCDGDYDEAEKEFARFRTLIERLSGRTLRTVCPHGNPTKLRHGWCSNKDFFRAKSTRQRYPNMIDIVVDFARLMPEGVYLSDAGFALRRIGNIGGNDVSNEAAISDGIAVDWLDVGRLAKENKSMVVSVHPHRLRESEVLLFLLRARMGILRSGYRVAKKIPFVKTFVSKFYAFARRL